MILSEVDPSKFISQFAKLPANGRGAWTKQGIDFEYRYTLSPTLDQRIGTQAEKSLAHWSVAAGSYAIQLRLVQLGLMTPVADSERGIWGPRTDKAIRVFQSANADPESGRDLTVDGLFGTGDARALWTPLINSSQQQYDIPNKLLLGQTNHESMLDPGAVGYYIYYPDYRGVDRGMSQINSKAQDTVTWAQAFNPTFALDWSAKRMRNYFDQYRLKYPKQSADILWDAACCAHNSPVNGSLWAAGGGPQNEASVTYMDGVRKAIY